MNILIKARDLAKAAHATQTDKLGEPYFAHPETVAFITLVLPSFHKLDSQQKIEAVAVAYLHDVVEDTDHDYQSLSDAGFSDNVIEAVRLLTKTEDTILTSYYQELIKNPVARVVKSADIIHNSQGSRNARLGQDTSNRLKAKYEKAASIVILEEDLELYAQSLIS